MVTDHEFEILVDQVHCRYGSAIGVEKAYPHLGLVAEDGPNDLDWVSRCLPVEIGYFDERYGLHSALIIGIGGEEVMLVNAGKTIMKWDEIEFPKWRHQQTFRSFRLRKGVRGRNQGNLDTIHLLEKIEEMYEDKEEGDE